MENIEEIVNAFKSAGYDIQYIDLGTNGYAAEIDIDSIEMIEGWLESSDSFDGIQLVSDIAECRKKEILCAELEDIMQNKLSNQAVAFVKHLDKNVVEIVSTVDQQEIKDRFIEHYRNATGFESFIDASGISTIKSNKCPSIIDDLNQINKFLNKSGVSNCEVLIVIIGDNTVVTEFNLPEIERYNSLVLPYVTYKCSLVLD
ncbi:MAG: hypothetical protein GY737_21760 [Desulfobacteraceae bacterium]|nr:hypothetical protein [Desulfobacteraceae bacterium]